MSTETPVRALSDKLSNTDPISNAVLIRGLDFVRHIGRLVQPGCYPIEALGSYLHESLHHVCFRAPVGIAIASLYHRAFQNAVELGEASDQGVLTEWDVLDDIVRVEATLSLMRPLAEGIALFAEFDAVPGNAKSISRVFRDAAVMFSQAVGGFGEEETVEALLGRLLSRARPDLPTRKRKESLLMQGFTTRHGGYLPGYYLVKNLQLALIQTLECELFSDSEFYLNFIVHWFYGDFNLVAALMDRSKEVNPGIGEAGGDPSSSQDAMDAIAVAFQSRLSQLFKGLSREMVEDFDRQLSSRTLSWSEIQIGFSKDDAREIEAQLGATCNELMNFSGASTTLLRAAREMSHDLFVRRNYLCLGSFVETAHVAANGSLHIAPASHLGQFPAMILGEAAVQPPWTGLANFDFLQSGPTSRIFVSVQSGSDRLYLNTLQGDLGAEADGLDGVNLSSSFCNEARDVMQRTIDRALEDDGISAIVRAHYRQDVDLLTEKVYHHWCGTLMLLDGREATIGPERGALLRLCGGDADFLRTLAAIGCSGATFVESNSIDRACEATGMNRSAFEAGLASIENCSGLRLLQPVGDFFTVTL